MSDSVRPQRWQPSRLPRPWDSPGKNTGVGCHFLLQPKSLVEGIRALLWGDPLISTDRPHLKSGYGQDDTPLQIWGPILLEKALSSLSSHRWNVGTT